MTRWPDKLINDQTKATEKKTVLISFEWDILHSNQFFFLFWDFNRYIDTSIIKKTEAFVFLLPLDMSLYYSHIEEILTCNLLDSNNKEDSFDKPYLPFAKQNPLNLFSNFCF